MEKRQRCRALRFIGVVTQRGHNRRGFARHRERYAHSRCSQLRPMHTSVSGDLNVTARSLLPTDVSNGRRNEIDEWHVVRARPLRWRKWHSRSETPTSSLIGRADQIEGFARVRRSALVRIGRDAVAKGGRDKINRVNLSARTQRDVGQQRPRSRGANRSCRHEISESRDQHHRDKRPRSHSPHRRESSIWRNGRAGHPINLPPSELGPKQSKIGVEEPTPQI